jgi:hypothetical protein
VEHVLRICPRHTESLPLGDSFYAFNITFIVAGKDEDPKSSRQRHAFICLFNSSCEEEEEASPPHPPTNNQEMSVNVVMLDEVCNRNPLDGLDKFG